MNLSGVFPALTTPFSADGSVSVADIEHNIAKYNSTGLAGYVAIGSTGESVLLSRKEVETVLVAVKESAASGMRLIAGTGAESTVLSTRCSARNSSRHASHSSRWLSIAALLSADSP